MSPERKKKRLRSAGNGRYGAFLSIGPLLGVKEPRLADALKVEFLPQWEGRGETDAVLSKRTLLVDLGVSDVTREEVAKLSTLLDPLRRAAMEQPDSILEIVRAFGRRGSKQEREKAVERAQRLGLWQRGDPEPVAIWGIGLLIGAAILIAGCCQETDTECDSDTDGDTGGGGSDGGGSDGGSTG